MLFDNIKLITNTENEELYCKQMQILEEYNKEQSIIDLIRFSLLYTLSPICDEKTAINILKSQDSHDFRFLIIGAYLVAYSHYSNNNLFIDKLLDEYVNYSRFEKSIVNYLIALHYYSNSVGIKDDIVYYLNKSISLCDDYVSNFYLRFVITKNHEDAAKARRNIKRVLSGKEIESLTVDDLIDPQRYINEYILMNDLATSIL